MSAQRSLCTQCLVWSGLGHREITEKPRVLRCVHNLGDPWGVLGGPLGVPRGLGGDMWEPTRVLGVPGGDPGGPWGAPVGVLGCLGGAQGGPWGLLGIPFGVIGSSKNH